MVLVPAVCLINQDCAEKYDWEFSFIFLILIYIIIRYMVTIVFQIVKMHVILQSYRLLDFRILSVFLAMIEKRDR